MSRLTRFALAFFLAAGAFPCFAGLYADDMGRCLVKNTSSQDKTDLVRWIFASAALHPDVAPLSSVTDADRSAINERIGKLLTRLLTDSCVSQTQDALKYEGAASFQLSFQLLGQVAMQELMTNERVSQGFAAISKYVDLETLKAPSTPAK